MRVRQRFAKMNLGGMSPEFLYYAASAFDFVPSLGLVGIVLGLHRCQKVTLYGFNVSWGCIYSNPGVKNPNRALESLRKPKKALRRPKEAWKYLQKSLEASKILKYPENVWRKFPTTIVMK